MGHPSRLRIYLTPRRALAAAGPAAAAAPAAAPAAATADMMMQGKLRWVPLLPPAPTSEKGDTTAPSSSGPASEAATTAKSRKSDKPVDEGQGGGVAEEKDEGFEFSWAGVEDLAKTHDLCATGPAFELALGAGDPEIGRYSSAVFLLKHLHNIY